MREGHARTLMSSYKRGYYMHSEFVFPAGWSGKGSGSIEPPRFFTPRECARLQGFPETFKLEGVLPRNSGRLYHHLGNAVAPPVIAAIAARLLSALNMTHAGGRPLPRGGARGEQERERQLLKPSLDIVLAASPPNEQLKAQIAAFLSSSTESDGLVPTHSGYSNDVEEGGGVAEIAALLSSREGRAQMAALRDVARLAHGSKAGRARASRNCAVMAAYPGLVERILEIGITRGDTPGASDRHEIKRLCNEDDTPRNHGNDDRPETSLEQNRSPCDHAHAGRERATSEGTGAASDAPRMRRMHEEVQRLALVALTNLAAEVEASGAALRAANVRQALTRAFVDENEGCVGGVVARLPKNLREQASVALELLKSGVVDEA
uniref:DNA (cytosine-5-)-methyltransferase n=2 Tax=Tetraselmis chuii TaxID=63592 RepID=A0A7S1X2Y6_9CHLO|mmetsp:Transcript_2303/g.4032  ORF Transcript_2303/g.4032 Transcript_2303/m.4032 type:complete len:379 (+) Transcript_2303:1310-2446(+)